VSPTPKITRAPRPRARRGEGDLLRGQILDAAERLLIETGDEEAVSIRAIAERVGVTPPAIYLHFADKAELIFAVCEEQFRALDRATERAARRARDPVESLRLRGRAYVQFGLDHPEQYRILFMGRAAATPSSFDTEHLRSSSAFDHLVDDVQRCIDAGAMPARQAFVVAVELWAVVHGITSLLLAKPAFPWPPVRQLVDDLLTIYCSGLQSAD
jgi:AcrR family transcriptional regulator